MGVTALKQRVDVLNAHLKKHNPTTSKVLKSKNGQTNKSILVSNIRIYECNYLSGESGSSGDEPVRNKKKKKPKKEIRKEKSPPVQTSKIKPKSENKFISHNDYGVDMDNEIHKKAIRMASNKAQTSIHDSNNSLSHWLFGIEDYSTTNGKDI
eukprot:398788_1